MKSFRRFCPIRNKFGDSKHMPPFLGGGVGWWIMSTGALRVYHYMTLATGFVVTLY